MDNIELRLQALERYVEQQPVQPIERDQLSIADEFPSFPSSPYRYTPSIPIVFDAEAEDAFPARRSLERYNDTSTPDIRNGNCQVYGVDTVPSATRKFAFFDNDSAAALIGQMKWAGMDADIGGNGFGAYKSLEIDATKDQGQIYKFNAPYSDTIKDADLLMMRSDTGSRVFYPTKTKAQHYLDVLPEDQGDSSYIWNILPPGGDKYMVLQKAETSIWGILGDGHIKWDWVRAHA